MQFNAIAVSWRISWSRWLPAGLTQMASTAESAFARIVFLITSPQTTKQPPAALITAWVMFLLIAFWGYLVFSEAFLLVFRPYGISYFTNTVGSSVAATSFTGEYLNILLGVLVVFIVYPSTLLFLTSRRTADGVVKRALVLLPRLGYAVAATASVLVLLASLPQWLALVTPERLTREAQALGLPFRPSWLVVIAASSSRCPDGSPAPKNLGPARARAR